MQSRLAPRSTAVNDPHNEHNSTPEKTEKFGSLAGRLLYHSLDDPRVQFETGLVMRGDEYTQSARRSTIALSSEIHCWNTWCGSAFFAGRVVRH